MSLETELSKLTELLTQLQSRGQQMSVFKAIEQGLADVVGIIEQQKSDSASEPAALAQAMREAFSGLKFEPNFNIPAPIVNVAAPEIAMPTPPAPPTGWRMRISKRDDIGRIAEILLTPEN